MKEIYFDHQAGSPLKKEITQNFSAWQTRYFSSLTALHEKGYEQIAEVNQNVKKIYAHFSQPLDAQLVVCEGRGVYQIYPFLSVYQNHVTKTGKNHFILPLGEEKELESYFSLYPLGCFVKSVPYNERGEVNLDILEQKLGLRSSLFSFSLADELTGVVQPCKQIAEICSHKQVLCHMDGTYFLGHGDLNDKLKGIDIFSCQIVQEWPRCGLIFFDKKLSLTPIPFLDSSFHAPSFLAFAQQIEMSQKMEDYTCTEVARLRDLFETYIKQNISDTSILFEDSERLPNVSLIGFKDILAEPLCFELQASRLYASMGSKNKPLSNALVNRQQKNWALSTLRFSFSAATTEEEIEEGAQRIVDAVNFLKTKRRQISYDH
ncbi:MAG: aminotransferase class V-fold PLP-dependent enzyme [Rhabdochlamydiaceae bacterium]